MKVNDVITKFTEVAGMCLSMCVTLLVKSLNINVKLRLFCRLQS